MTDFMNLIKKNEKGYYTIITPREEPVRIRYPHLFNPSKYDDNAEPKYSVQALIKKGSLVDQAFQYVIGEFQRDYFNKRNPKTTYRDGDDQHEELGIYAGHNFVNLTNKNQPKILGPNGEQIDGFEGNEIQCGDWGRLIINPSVYGSPAKGVTFYLQAFMLLKQGELIPKKNAGPSPEELFQLV